MNQFKGDAYHKPKLVPGKTDIWMMRICECRHCGRKFEGISQYQAEKKLALHHNRIHTKQEWVPVDWRKEE